MLQDVTRYQEHSTAATSLKRRRKNAITPPRPHPSNPSPPGPRQNTAFAKITTVPPQEERRHQKNSVCKSFCMPKVSLCNPVYTNCTRKVSLSVQNTYVTYVCHFFFVQT